MGGARGGQIIPVGKFANGHPGRPRCHLLDFNFIFLNVAKGFKNIYSLIMCKIYAYIWHVSVGTRGGQKKASDPLVLGLQAVESHPLWVLGTKLKSRVRAASVLNCWSISPVPGTSGLKFPGNNTKFPRQDIFNQVMIIIIKNLEIPKCPAVGERLDLLFCRH